MVYMQEKNDGKYQAMTLNFRSEKEGKTKRLTADNVDS
jgi:hypothetical protein